MFHWESLAFYWAYSIFSFYNQKWGRDFKGGSKAAHTVIVWMGFASLLTSATYFIYYGYNYSWWGAVIALGISLPVAGLLGFQLERLFGTVNVCLVSVFAWPVCAFFMFYLLP